ncbi:hypothetical protein AC1031_019948 [Aphanomyces cochlioides]|nr:hypothetical protein AC1031_019948 [Aphanomyces cochlioides]
MSSRDGSPLATQLSDALTPAGGTLAAGFLLSSVRARRLKTPSPVFVALSAGCGVFRFLNHQKRNSKLAAVVASVVFYRLCSKTHRQLVLAYGYIEVVLQFYWDHRFLPAIAEDLVALLTTMRAGYAYLVHADWFPPSTLKMLDFQASIPRADLIKFRSILHTCELTRCEAMHPGQACAPFLVKGTANILRRSVDIFVPLQAISIVTALISKKTVAWTKVVDQFARSAIFLTVSYMAPIASSCVFPQRSHKLVALFASTIPYAALYIEPDKRRTSLLRALACWSLLTFMSQIQEWKVWKRVSHLPWTWIATTTYAACMARILERPETQNQLMTRYLYGRWILRQEKFTLSTRTDEIKKLSATE